MGGLPFIRSSVDHGTAFDIAGTGKTHWVGMAEAIGAGAGFARRLREHDQGRALSPTGAA